MHEIRSTLIRGERRTTLATKDRAAAASRRKDAGLVAIRIKREESRCSDQRTEPRHLGVVDRAILRYQRRPHEVAVLNVSRKGVMIETDLPLHIGARLEMRFEGCNPTDCFVRWIRDGRVGLEFGTETVLIGAGDVRERFVGGRREGEHPTLAVKSERAPRQGLILKAELHTRYGSSTVKLRNISADGVMLEADRDLDPWTEVVLEIPGAAVQGRVRWCRSRQIGIAFDSPFDLETVLAPEPRNAASGGPDYMKPDYLRSETDPGSPWASRRERLTIDDL